jgi:hypothetical protein
MRVNFPSDGRDAHAPADVVHPLGDQIHADAPARILGDTSIGRESRLEQQREYLLGIE